MWIIILSAVLAVLIYMIAIKPAKYWTEKGAASVKGWPIFGNVGANIIRKRDIPHILEDIYKAYPEKRYVGFFNMTKPTLMIRDPDLIKKITVKEFDSFPEHRQIIPEDVDSLWNKNLFSMKEMKDAFTRFTNDVIATTAFGITCDSLEQQNNEFYLMGKEATTFTGLRALYFAIQIISPTISRCLGITVFSKAVSRFFRGLIKETLKVREEQGILRPDMVQLLMEARKGHSKNEDHPNSAVDSGFAVVQESGIGETQQPQKLEITDDDITANALIFFAAGFDTVSTTMCYASYELALNPDIQKRLHKEIDEASQKSKGAITYETLLGMKYLDIVLTEILRKWPPVVFTDRSSVKPFVIPPENPEENPLHLEEGSMCFIPIYPIQRDPKYYPNPDKFDPERFSDENKHQIKPFTFLPFGAGPRSCIGSRFALLEVKLVIVEILSNFEIVPVEKTPIPIVFTKSGFNPLPNEGFWLGLKPRYDLL